MPTIGLSSIGNGKQAWWTSRREVVAIDLARVVLKVTEVK